MLSKVTLGCMTALVQCIAADASLSVCDALKRAAELHGKVVVVTGKLRSLGGSRDGAPFDQLVSEACSAGREEEPVIGIVPPDVHFLANPPAGYNPDARSIRKAEIKLSQLLRRNPQTDSIRAKVTGILYKSKDAGNRSSTVRRHPWYAAYLVIAKVELLTAVQRE